ncbi:MAG TPA: S9 family peptidase [Candidatus Acidoferrales bacterium]|nr:S9 family peptidase [Candidatus Acidoferrales bacterium]
MKITFTLLALLAAAYSALGADKLTIEKAMQVREPSDLQWAPDGKRVALTLQEPAADKPPVRHIWVYDLTRRELRQWTWSAKSESMPRWSPDGRTLAFLSDREDSQQIWLMPIGGGEATKLTSAKNSVDSFHWSHDGNRIAYLASDPKTADEEKRQKDQDDARVIDGDRKPVRAWTVDVATKAIKRITSGPWNLHEISWLPGKRLLAIATDRPADDRRTERLYSVSLGEGPQDGRMEEILAPPGPLGKIQVNPRGGAVAFVSSPGDGPTAQDLFVLPLGAKSPKNLTGVNMDRPVLSFQWMGPDGMGNAEIATLFENGFHTELDAAGEKRRTLIAPDSLVGASLDVSQFAVSEAGAVAYVAESAAVLPELFVEGKPVSHFNEGFQGVALQKAELYRYRSFDGAQIEAALFRGAGAAAGQAQPVQPQPVVVMIHGGPAGAWRSRFDALTQLLVTRGYTVMQPNIRGSTGYGQKFLAANRGDWGGGDYKDVMAGVDDLVRRGIADPNRLGIGGWSYGGYMAEWAITQTGRFKFAICGAGMADLATEFGTEARSAGDEWYYGIPYENLAGFQKSSPITFIKNARTPTLILQGEADTTDPISQSQMLYRGLKRYNVPAEFVVYPREPHGLREPKHVADRYRRSLEWADRYVGPAGPPVQPPLPVEPPK